MTIELASGERRLLRRASAPDRSGLIVSVDSETAGWEYLEFAAYRLSGGDRIDRVADGHERLVLVLEGRAIARSGARDFGSIGSRTTVFDGPPPPVILVGPDQPIELVAETDALVVVAGAPGGTISRTVCVPS